MAPLKVRILESYTSRTSTLLIALPMTHDMLLLTDHGLTPPNASALKVKKRVGWTGGKKVIRSNSLMSFHSGGHEPADVYTPTDTPPVDTPTPAQTGSCLPLAK